MFFLQQLINGLAQGSIYSLMAIGLAVIIGVVGLVSFVNGEVIMVGAVASYLAITYLTPNPILAVLAGMLAAAVMGIAVEYICYRPFRKSKTNNALIATIGLSIFAKSLMQVIFGTEQKFMPDLLGTSVIVIGDLRISYVQIMIIAIVIALSALLQLVLYRTRTGVALRAVSMDKTAAALLGVNVNRTVLIGNAIGCGLGGVAGVLIGIYYNSVYALLGASVAMKAFASVVFGGLTSIPGAAVGGLVLGVIENMAVTLFSSGYKDIVAFIVIIVILVIKPSGILGRKGVGI